MLLLNKYVAVFVNYFKSVYTDLWVINYLLPYNPFSTVETSRASRYSASVLVIYIL